jgi:hypothetical protein
MLFSSSAILTASDGFLPRFVVRWCKRGANWEQGEGELAQLEKGVQIQAQTWPSFAGQTRARYRIGSTKRRFVISGDAPAADLTPLMMASSFRP